MENKETEQVNIQVKNQVIQERSLIKTEETITVIFQSICSCFASSLFIQVILLIPSSYNLINQLPVIILLLLILSSSVLIILKKIPTINTYLIVLAVLIGLLIGI